MLSDLAHSLIYQLCISFSGADFVLLDTSKLVDRNTGSLAQALEFLHTLLVVESDGLLLVLDGVDILDSSDDVPIQEHLEFFLDMLNILGLDNKVKVPVTIESHSELISSKIGWESIVDPNMSRSSSGLFCP